MAITKVLILCIAFTLVTLLPASCVENPLTNPSFEDGLNGWNTYALPENGALPIVGCVGSSPCVFDVLPPASVPDGTKVCGLQSLYPTDPPRNGGVYQIFTWSYGYAEITVSGRAYSVDSGSNPVYDGCRVYAALADFATSDSSQATQSSMVTWGDYSTWQTATLLIFGPGTYTLFIENCQLVNNATISTLWDNVSLTAYISMTDGPTVSVGDDPNRPDTTARISWTTDTPSTSRVDYGLTTAYGQYVEVATPTTNHSVLLENLTPSGHYHFKVTSTASNAVEMVSDGYTFDLPIRFSNITASTEGSGVIIRWNTDVATTSQVEYGKTTEYGSTTTLDPSFTTNHQVTLSGLDGDADYHFRVWATKPLYTTASSGDNTLHTYPSPSATLLNPSFESSLLPWVLYEASLPGNNPIDGRLGPYPAEGEGSWSAAGIKAYDGSYFIGAAASLQYKNGGVLQRIYWPAGQKCSFCARFATRSVGGGFFDTRARLGIDPNGGTDPTASRIVWWSGFSPTNDNKWYPGGVTATAGSAGVVTVFLDIAQQYSINTHIVAIDDITFGAPTTTSIGALKQEQRCRPLEIQDALVTAVASPVTYEGVVYAREYIQRDDSPAGIAVLYNPLIGSPPNVGDKATIRGTLVVAWKEASILAGGWDVTEGPFTLPTPFGMSQRCIGGSAHNQLSLYPSRSALVCNVGTRVRLWGCVTDSYFDFGEDATICRMDDGTRLIDHVGGTIKGVKVKLAGYSEVYAGDYVMATGVLTMEHVDPDSTPGSNDEYDIYNLVTNSTDDWTSIPAAEF